MWLCSSVAVATTTVGGHYPTALQAYLRQRVDVHMDEVTLSSAPKVLQVWLEVTWGHRAPCYVSHWWAPKVLLLASPFYLFLTWFLVTAS